MASQQMQSKTAMISQGQASGMDGTALTLISAISKTIRDGKKFIKKALKHLQKLCKIPKFERPG